MALYPDSSSLGHELGLDAIDDPHLKAQGKAIMGAKILMELARDRRTPRDIVRADTMTRAMVKMFSSLNLEQQIEVTTETNAPQVDVMQAIMDRLDTIEACLPA